MKKGCTATRILKIPTSAEPPPVDKEELGAFCAKNHIIQLSLFGSALTERFSEKSDIDLLAQFDSDNIP